MRRGTIGGFLIIILLLFGNTLRAQEAMELSLKKARQYALENSYGIMNARLDIKKAKEQVWETTASGLPQVSANVNYRNNLKLPVTLVPAKFFDPNAPEGEFAELKFGTQHNASLTVQANQLIFSGPYIVGLKASRTYLELSKKQMEKREMEVRETVSMTYYSALVAEESKRLLEKSRQTIKRSLNETKKMHEQGLIEETNVDQIRLNLKNLNNRISSTQRQFVIAVKALKYQMGMSLDREIVLIDSLKGILHDIDLARVARQKFNLQEHVDFKLINTREQIQQLNLQKEKMDYLPSISAFAQHDEQAMRDEFNFFGSEGNWFPSTTIGFQMDIPIFSSGMRYSRVQKAQLDLEKTRVNKKQLADGLTLEVERAKSDYRDALEKYNTQRENLNLSKKIYDRNLKKYRQGMLSSLELTQTHNQYIQTQTSYFQAIFQLLNSKNKLDKALNNY
ncbi:MAG: TolC family protein [Bacteroidales bacterium]|nr:TolC family protein [Bacteroidales bacterium]